MDSSWKEETIDFPADVVENSIGMSLDIGGSVVKIVYRSKDDYDKGVPKDKEKRKVNGRLHLLYCPRKCLEKALNHAIETCDWLTEGLKGKQSLYTTGIGTNFFHAKLSEELETSIHNGIEFECFARALHFMCNNLSKDQLFHPPSKEGYDMAKPILDHFIELQNKMSKFSEAKIEMMEDGEERKGELQNASNQESGPLLPAILCICGSAVAIIKVEKDGTFTILDAIPGGITALGLAKLLTDEQDFDAVMELAEKGDRGGTSSVDVYGKDIIVDKDGDGYSGFHDDLMIFPFGKLVANDLGSVLREDLAYSLLHNICMTTAQTAHLYGVTTNVNRLYFCGNFVSHPLIRTLLTNSMAIRNFMRPGGAPPMDFQFVQAGGHLGALGAYMMGSQKKE